LILIYKYVVKRSKFGFNHSPQYDIKKNQHSI